MLTCPRTPEMDLRSIPPERVKEIHASLDSNAHDMWMTRPDWTLSTDQVEHRNAHPCACHVRSDDRFVRLKKEI